MIYSIKDGKITLVADVSERPDWNAKEGSKSSIKNKPITSFVPDYDSEKEYKQDDIIFKDNGYYRFNNGVWDLIIVPRIDINLESISSVESQGLTQKLLLQFDKDIDEFIDLQNVKLGGELLVDQVRFLGNGLYELDISNISKTFETDIFLKKNLT